MKYVVIDLEMNPIAKEHAAEKALCRSEIIQIGAVVLDERYQEIGHFMTLVKPQYNRVIAPNITKLTGISTEMVQSAPIFEYAVEQFFCWCAALKDEIQLCQWSESDREQLVSEMNLKFYPLTMKESHLMSNWLDFQQEYDEKLGVENQVSLKKAMMYAGVDFEGRPHDALNDARNTGTLMRIVRDPELCEKALANVIAAFRPKSISASLGDLFNFDALLLPA